MKNRIIAKQINFIGTILWFSPILLRILGIIFNKYWLGFIGIGAMILGFILWEISYVHPNEP